MRDDPLTTLPRTIEEVLAAGLTGLDLVLLAIAAVLALGGLRTGLLARAATWAGVLLGFVLSGRTVPLALGLAAEAGLPARTFVAVLALTLTVSLTSVGLQLVTAPIRRCSRSARCRWWTGRSVRRRASRRSPCCCGC